MLAHFKQVSYLVAVGHVARARSEHGVGPPRSPQSLNVVLFRQPHLRPDLVQEHPLVVGDEAVAHHEADHASVVLFVCGLRHVPAVLCKRPSFCEGVEMMLV